MKSKSGYPRYSALSIVKKYHPNVTRVVDANRNVQVEVTASDSKLSKPKAPDSCAMAKAFCRTHDGAIVSLAVAYLIDGNKAVRYRVPGSVSRELVSFDRSHVFSPGSYSLYAPVSTERLSAIRAAPKIPKRTGMKTVIRRYHHTAGIRTL